MSNQYPKRNKPAPEILKAFRVFLVYEPETGILYYAQPRGSRGKVGQRAGWKNAGDGGGYIIVQFFGIEYKAHHIIWYLVTGKWPDDEVDHKNYDRADNRIENLREATGAQNNRNKQRKLPKSGVRGVYARGKNWYTRIKCNGVAIYIGTFPTKEQAEAEYLKRQKLLFGEFAPV